MDWSQLPAELLPTIFYFLRTVHQVHCARQVCRIWSRAYAKMRREYPDYESCIELPVQHVRVDQRSYMIENPDHGPMRRTRLEYPQNVELSCTRDGEQCLPWLWVDKSLLHFRPFDIVRPVGRIMTLSFEPGCHFNVGIARWDDDAPRLRISGNLTYVDSTGWSCTNTFLLIRFINVPNLVRQILQRIYSTYYMGARWVAYSHFHLIEPLFKWPPFHAPD